MVKILKYIVMLIYFFRVVAIYDPTIMFVTKTLSLLKGFIFYFLFYFNESTTWWVGFGKEFSIRSNKQWNLEKRSFSCVDT